MGEDSSSRGLECCKLFLQAREQLPRGKGKKKKKEKFWKSRLRKMTKLASFFFKSRMLMIIRHSEIKMMVKKSDSTQGTMSGCFGDS